MKLVGIFSTRPRPVNLKIYAGRPFFYRRFCLLSNAFNEKFSEGDVLKFVTVEMGDVEKFSLVMY